MQSLGHDTATPKTNWRGAVARQIAGVRQFLSDVLARSALREQFADLDRRGSLDAVLDDIGVSRPELGRVIRNHPETGRLMPAMAQHLGVDTAKLDPRSRYALGRSCALCQAHGICRHWLATASSESTEYRAFCPNAALFDAALGSSR